jgi:hypothetical protein
MAVGASIGLAILLIAVFGLESYGLALFMGAPFVVGLATAFLLRRRYPATVRETMEVVTMTIVLLAGSTFLVGFEGAGCLVMAAPLALVIALMGGLVGRFLAASGESASHGALLIAILFPGAASLEGGSRPSLLREVTSSVVIDAHPDVVWNHVVAFSPIPEPKSILFRFGIAYPTHAEIRGSGVGAIRYCYFSTGAFVEPITAWEPGRKLSFDVIENPRPLAEFTLWNVAPPHLDGYLVSKAGEFRLIELADGRTRLEGSTWYEQRLRPEGYWTVFSDFIIGRIHARVLDHIKAEATLASLRLNPDSRHARTHRLRIL